MTELGFEFDKRQMRRIRKELSDIPNGVKRATQGAINKTLTKGRTATSSAIRNDIPLNVKARDVKKRIRLVKATKAKPDKGKLEVRGGRWKMMKLGARPITPPAQKGVPIARRKKVSASPFKRRVHLPHHFVQQMPSGHVGVFVRPPGQKKKIVEVYGPHLAKLIPKHGIGRKVERVMSGELSKQMESQVDRLLKRKKR